ncbi:bacteriocin [Chryseobacterium sp. M5A1_1a]
MKKLNIQQKKLTKKELKEINGGNRVFCLRGFCMIPGSDELVPGLIGEGGYCC